jgi:hypothetical protein
MTTELSNLPSDPSVPKTNSAPQIPQNIKMETSAYQNDLDKKPTIPPVADTKQMETMVNSLESAAKQGLTSLAEDIPKETTHLTQDKESIVNTIPEPPQETTSTPIDYIKNFATQEEIAEEITKQENKQTTVEFILEEMKIPIILSVIFFVFQSKAFNKLLLGKFPKFFNDTGGLTSNGLIIQSFLFGITYLIATKTLTYFSL